MNKFFYGSVAAMCAFSLTGAATAQEITVAKDSPLYKRVQETMPGAEEAYKSFYRRGHSKQVVASGWQHFKKKDFNGALNAFFLAINMDYKNPSAYFGVAYVCSIQNNMTDAIIFYREALKYEKNYSPIYANLAKALLIKNNNKSDEAISLLDQAIKVDPKNADALLTYAAYYSQKNDWKQAGEKAQLAIEAGGQLPEEAITELQQHGVQIKTK